MNWQLSSLLRVISITLVIAIHASNRWWFGSNGDTSLDRLNLEIFFDTTINQVGRFTVPLFVILSGFSLAKAETSHPFSFKRFWQRRAIRILPPYIFFSLINIAFQASFQLANWSEKLSFLWQAFQKGSGDYHLYFLVIIIQCYIGYPLLRLLPFSTFNLGLLAAFTVGVFALRWSISLFGLFAPIATYIPDSNHWIFWLSYFLLGIWLARAPEWFAQRVQHLSSSIWGGIWAIAAILELSEFFFAALKIGSAEAVGHYGRPTVVLLTIAFLLWSMSWQYDKERSGNGSDLPSSRKEQGLKVIETLSNASFSVFLTHVWVLRLITPLEVVGGFAYPVIAAIASWIVGVLVWQLVRSVKGLNLIFGA
jgi:probable poly-beta-1,6-N-acetyl-D-glucosamine export protein